MPDITEVDFQELGRTIPPFMDAASGEVNQRILPVVQAAHRNAHPRENGVECALGSMQIPEVQQWSRHLTGTFEAVDTNARAMMASLDQTARAIGAIAQRYHTAEERNATSAADIAKMLPH